MKENKGFYQPLPANLYPTGEVCVNIRIPNDIDWIKLFWGHFLNLTKWHTFERDTAHNARIVAARWLQIWNAARSEFNEGVACYVPPIYQEPECGLIQVSNNSGVDWLTLADFRECFIKRSPENAAQNTVITTDNFAPLTLYNPFSSWEKLIHLISPTRQVSISGEAIYNVFGGGCVFTVGGNLDFLRVDFPLSGINEVNFAIANTYKRLHIGNSLDVSAILGSQSEIPLGMWHVYGQNSDETLLVLQAASGQNADMHRNIDSSDSLISGVDWDGRYYMAQISTEPSDPDARPATIMIDPDAQLVYVKGDEIGVNDWWVLGGTTPECACIETASAITLDPGDPATAEIVGTELIIGVPRGEQGEQGEQGDEGEPGADGKNGLVFLQYQARPNPGEDKTVIVACLADGYAMYPFELREGDVIDFGVIDGWWDNEGFTPGASSVPNYGFDFNGTRFGQPYGTWAYDSANPYPLEPNMALLLQYIDDFDNVQYVLPNTSGTWEVPAISSTDKYAWFSPNSAVLDGNSGGVRIPLTLTANLPPLVEFVSKRYVSGGCPVEYDPYGASGSQTVNNLCGDGTYKIEIQIYNEVERTTLRNCQMKLTALTGFTDEGSTYRNTAGTTQIGLPGMWQAFGGRVLIRSSTPFSFTFEIREVE